MHAHGRPIVVVRCACLDLNFSERSSDTPELVCASLVHSNKIVLLQEENKLALVHLQGMVELSLEGNLKIFQILKQEVSSRGAAAAAEARSGESPREFGLELIADVFLCMLLNVLVCLCPLQTKSYSEAILRSRGMLNA